MNKLLYCFQKTQGERDSFFYDTDKYLATALKQNVGPTALIFLNSKHKFPAEFNWSYEGVGSKINQEWKDVIILLSTLHVEQLHEYIVRWNGQAQQRDEGISLYYDASTMVQLAKKELERRIL